MSRLATGSPFSLFGTAVHAVLRAGPAQEAAGGTAVEQIRSRLQAEGLEISSIERVEASLEDVFLDVVEKAGRG
jgi:hypothetical protein